MKFEERSVTESNGWTLAHSILCGQKRIAKGTVLTASLIERLSHSGIRKVQVFLLEESDVDEDTAAERAAGKITGSGLNIELAGKGRANIIAICNGLFVPRGCIDAVNATDDAFSAASLASHTPVRTGQLVATIKLVPYGLPAATLNKIPALASLMAVKPFRGFTASLLVTGESPTHKTIAGLTARIEQVGGRLLTSTPIKHTQNAVKTALEHAKASATDLILMLGASAISDERDIFPAALINSGGKLIKLGMPADPGNLLMLGTLNDKTVIGLPGCARSPALNGFDWVLERFAAKEPLDAKTLTKMGTGGLLKEPAGRKTPRANAATQLKSTNSLPAAAIVLAAGKSSRAKNIHKLLSTLGNKTVIATTIDNLLGVKNLKIMVITGHRASEINACMPAKKVSCAHNPGFEQGMGTSIAVGMAVLTEPTGYAFICLGDMPFVQPSTYEKMLKTASEISGAAIFIPTFHGKRGHPVLWHNRFFADLKRLHGDTGGKKIISDNPEKVIEVPVDDPGILIDLDTPEMLAQFGVTSKDQ